MKDFRSLDVWEKSHELVLAIYRVTAAFPKNELYGLISQIRRAAASIPANIVRPVKYMIVWLFHRVNPVK